MYIDKLDNFIDKLVDEFSYILKTTKIMQDIIKEKNFVKYQKEINDIVIEFCNKIDFSKIQDVLINNDNVKPFNEIIKKYVIIYMILYIASNYTESIDLFSNNLVEFTKNQSNYKFKIDNFFGSETNFRLIEFYKLIKNVSLIIDIFDDENKIKTLVSKKPDLKTSYNFLHTVSVGELKNEKTRTHNLIKCIIFIELYQKKDKKEISDIIENTTIDGEEYTYIDIVVPTRDTIDYSAIESILDRKEIMMGHANTFWEYLMTNQDAVLKLNLLEETVESKILHLINSGILIPVLDDFLLYHKDNETYEKNMDSNILKDNKKRYETKIKYIVSKIDSTSDLYSNTLDKNKNIESKKNFFTPLNNRKAILVNHNEDIKIITKLINQGNKVLESNDRFDDLINYKVYPYINFKDFKDCGFTLHLNKTVSAVRSVSLEHTGDFRQNKYSPMQMRVGAKNQFVNIIGFIIPSNINPIECTKVKDLKNIHNYGTNGYDLTMAYLNEGTIKNTPHKSAIYWLFDTKRDNVTQDNYSHKEHYNEQDVIKNIIAKFYDDILVKIYDEFSRKIDTFKEISIQKARKILDIIQKKTLTINNPELLNNIEHKIFDKAISKEEKYDEKEDIFYGLGGVVNELPIYQKKQNIDNIIKMDVSKKKDTNVMKEIEEIDGVCQHNITWEFVNKLKKTDPSKYQDKIYDFIQEYVIENNEGDYVCKSCSTQIDVKKFIIDGTFDDDTNKFVTFSMPFDIPLDELAEYEKYKVAIRSLDKVIEKIAMVNNIPAYIGNMFNIRSKRKNITKDLIDLVIDNNHFLTKRYKERTENSVKLYNISKELTDIFIFNFENSIFVFSSKEKDYYKNKKYNNILAYIIILLCLDINDSQLSFMIGDQKGVCNIQVFEKYGHVLFDNLRIIKNKNGDTVPIKNYMILCYMIYLMSCTMTKYSMWFYENDDNTKESKKKFNPIIQKIIVHTTIDILNSIIENSSNKKAGIIFEIITTKFFLKLNTLFNDNELYIKLKTDISNTYQSNKKLLDLPKNETIHKLIHYYEPIINFDLPIYNKIKNRRFIPNKKISNFKKFNDINNMTNCNDGNFHKWVSHGKDIKCDLCKSILGDLILSNSNSEIKKNNKYITLQKLTNKHCISGKLHIKDNNNICKLCNKNINTIYTHNELDTLNKNLNKNKLKILNYMDTNILDKNELLINLKNQYNKNKDNYINSFVDLLKNNIGDNKDINFDENIYTIDHLYDGTKLDKPILLTNKDKKIIFKSKHHHFKTDVLTYSFNKTANNKIEVFYDAINKVLLGYKETSKDYVSNNSFEHKIKINYSITYKLKYLGFESDFIDIYSKINKTIGFDDYKNLKQNEKEECIEDIVLDIFRDRTKNLKKVIYEIQRIINQIKTNTINTEQPNDEIDHFNKLMSKYAKKLTDFNYNIFENWSKISDDINSISNNHDLKEHRFNIDIDETSKIIEANEIIKFDTNGNMFLFYIVNELTQLIHSNSNKFIKNNLVSIIIDIITHVFNIFNLELIQSNLDVKRLEYILTGFIFADELDHIITELNSGNIETDDIEHIDEIDNLTKEDMEQINDEKEEADALDIDGEFDYESNYEYIYEKN